MNAPSGYLQRILNAMYEHTPAVPVDAYGEPDPRVVSRLAAALGELPDEVRQALLGLRAADCLIEETLDIPGAELLVWWRVHPQCITEP